MIKKTKKCRQCKCEFTPTRPLQHVCSPRCAIALVTVKREAREIKLERLGRKEKKERLKTRAQWLKEAQMEFNKFIRLRDVALPCISCQRFHTGQYHAGHYRTVGSAGHLRFNEHNVHKQCAPCNNHLSGNIIRFRASLIEKIGIANVEALEANNEPKKYTIDEIKAIKQIYKEKIKEIENK